MKIRSLPIPVEIAGLMKLASPSAFFTDMLNERWRMVKHRRLEASRESRYFYVLFAINRFPMFNHKLNSVPRQNKRLASETRIVWTQGKIFARAAGERTRARIVKAGQGCSSRHERRPVQEIA